jgi:hypothetical protein
VSIVILAVCWGDGAINNGIGITCTGEFRNAYKVLVGELRGRDPLGILAIGLKTVLKLNFMKLCALWHGIGLSWSGIWYSVGCMLTW